VPDEVARVGELMATYDAPWALSGGWAVDAWLGKITREHGDIDVVVFDQTALHKHLAGWQLLAHDPAAPEYDDEWWEGQRVLSPGSHIHSRPPERSGALPKGGIATKEDGFNMEFYVNEQDGDGWVFNRTPYIALPLERCIAQSPSGVPVAVPEAVFFFKSREPRQRDRRDFDEALPQLGDAQRAWLHDALTRTGHPWLPRLSG
jgi:hypothetical protein